MEMVTMEIIINGNTVSGTAQELAQLIALVDTATESAVKEADKVAKPKPKREPKPKAVMTKSEHAMCSRAIAALANLDYECKARKQGSWLWIYPTGGQGRSEGFKTAKLAKGWKHSPKRGAFYRKMD